MVKYMKIKNKKSFYITLTSLLIFLVSIFLISYAYLKPRVGAKAKTAVNITSCGYFTFLDGSSSINLTNTYPMSDNMGKKTTPYTFSVKNTCAETSNFVIYLVVPTTSEIDDVYINYDLQPSNQSGSITNIIKTDLDPSLLAQIKTLHSYEVKSVFELTTDTIGPGVTKNYNIKLWVNKIAPNSIMNKSFSASLAVIDYDDKLITFKDIILEDNGGKIYIEEKPAPNFANVATTNEGMFAAQDDYGTSYYFRGAVDNNWVKFGKIDNEDIWWRIIRINGNGSVKLIYSGTTAPILAERIVMTGNKTSIGSSKVNSPALNMEDFGYMYEQSEPHGITSDSIMKSFIDTWYEDNLINYTPYLADNLFCNDRTFYLSASPNNQVFLLGPTNQYPNLMSGSRYRTSSLNQPSLLCPQQADSFTVADKLKGNAALTYPVGLINEDEVWMAGATTQSNSEYYLYNNITTSTMSPGTVTSGMIYFTRIYNPGYLTGSNKSNADYVRPVISINLEPGTTIVGDGTWNNPYRFDQFLYKNDTPVSFSSLGDIATTIQDFEGRNYLLGTQNEDFNIPASWAGNTTASVRYEDKDVIHRAVPITASGRYGYLQNVKYIINVTEDMTFSMEGRGNGTAFSYNYYISTTDGNSSFGTMGSWNSTTFTKLSKYLPGYYKNNMRLLLGSVNTTPLITEWAEIRRLTLNKGSVAHPYQLAPEDLKYAKSYILPYSLTERGYTLTIDNDDHNWIGVWLGKNHFAGYLNKGKLTFQGINTNEIILKAFDADTYNELNLYETY